MYPVTSVTASVLTLIYLCLSVKVVTLRKRLRVSIGSDGHRNLDIAIRAHGNFSEYVPLMLILLLCAEAGQTWFAMLVTLAVAFIIGRAFHIAHFLYDNRNFTFRAVGMMLTFIPMLLLAFWNILSLWW